MLKTTITRRNIKKAVCRKCGTKIRFGSEAFKTRGGSKISGYYCMECEPKITY